MLYPFFGNGGKNMSNKVKGYVLGILASLAVVALWIVLYVFAGIIAGYIGALMALSIIMIYKKFNPEDNSNVIYVVASVIGLFEIFIAEFASVGIMCAQANVDFATGVTKVFTSIVLDVVAIILSALVLFYYIRQQTKKAETRKVESTVSPVENTETSEETNESEK